MKRDGLQRKSAVKAIALIKDKVGQIEKDERKAKRDEKKKIAAAKKVAKKASIPGEGSRLKDGKKSGKSIIKTTQADQAAKDGLGPRRMDKSCLLGDAERMDDVNQQQYAQYIHIMDLMKKGGPFKAAFKLEQKEYKFVLTNQARWDAINNGQFDMQPMVGGSVVLGGGRVLGKKEDYENNDRGSAIPCKEEVAPPKMIVTFWSERKKAHWQDIVIIEPMDDVRLFVTNHYWDSEEGRAQLQLSRLVRYPNIIWSLLYHALIEKTKQSIEVVEGDSVNKCFEFTGEDAFEILFPVGYDWTFLNRRIRKLSKKANENLRQQMMNCRGE